MNKEEFFRKALLSYCLWEDMRPDYIYTFADWDKQRQYVFLAWADNRKILKEKGWYNEFKSRYFKP